MTTFPSKLTKGELQAVKSSGLKFSLLYKSGYKISAPLPWSTITLFLSYPSIISMTIKASSWGYMVSILSSSKKLSAYWIPILAFSGFELVSSANSWAIDITLEGQEQVLPRGSKDDIYRSQRRSWRSISLGFWICLTLQTTRMMQKLLQFSFSDQLIQMIP